MPNSKMILELVISEMFGENAFIAHLEGRDDCVVVDPGFDADAIISQIEEKGLTPVAILNTHGHGDHIAGNKGLKQRWPECPLVIGAAEASKLTNPEENLSTMFGLGLVSPAADHTVQEGDIYSAAGFDFHVLETPGHSIGHVVYLWKGESPWILFDGDMLFHGGIGRADFPDGDPHQLLESIRTKLYTLPNDTIVWPGHGDATTIGGEKKYNPFVRG